MSDALPPAGWYADPSDAGQQRYWDGSTWTEHVAPAAGGATATSGGAAAPVGGQGSASTSSVDPWTWQSILATILCCNVIGVVGVLNAGRADAAVRAGDLQGARASAAKARTWTLWAIGIQVAFLGLVGLLLVAGVVTSADMQGGF